MIHQVSKYWIWLKYKRNHYWQWKRDNNHDFRMGKIFMEKFKVTTQTATDIIDVTMLFSTVEAVETFQAISDDRPRVNGANLWTEITLSVLWIVTTTKLVLTNPGAIFPLALIRCLNNISIMDSSRSRILKAITFLTVKYMHSPTFPDTFFLQNFQLTFV